MSIRFGIISDPQYSDIDDMKGLLYRQSLGKLKSAIEVLNGESLEFVMQLGDFIDHEYESFAPALKVWEALEHKSYHVLGNHDFCVRPPFKERVLNTLGLKTGNYSFESGNYKFIVLNGNGLSFNAYDADSAMYQLSESYYESLSCESEWWNGAIDKPQMEWFKEELESAEYSGKSVIVFCHYPLLGEDRFLLWNSSSVIELLEQFSCVKAWLNGHYHEGNYSVKNNIHYLTMKGMVQFEQLTFSIAELSGNSLQIRGFGAEECRLLEF